MDFFVYIKRFPRRVQIALFLIVFSLISSLIYVVAANNRPRTEDLLPVTGRWDASAGIKIIPDVRHTPAPEASGAGAPPPAQDSVSVEMNCTYTEFYWLENQDRWLIENIMIGNKSYPKNQILDLLSIQSPSPRDTLLKYLLTSLLNAMQGVDTRIVDDTIEAAGLWLSENQDKSFLSTEEELQALALAERLRAFNDGENGIVACPGQALARRMTPSPDLPAAPGLSGSTSVSAANTPTAVKGRNGGGSNPPSATSSRIPASTWMPTVPTTPATGILSPSRTVSPSSTLTPALTPVDPAWPTQRPEPTGVHTPKSTKQPEPTPTPLSPEPPKSTKEPKPTKKPTSTRTPQPTSTPTPAGPVLTDPPPTEPAPTELPPTEPLPTGTIPPEPSPTEPAPTDTVPTDTVPTSIEDPDPTSQPGSELS